MVEEHFAALEDRRFLAPSDGVQQPTLRDLMGGPPRFTFTGRRRIAVGLMNAGAWLREFHGLIPEDDSPAARATADEVEAALREQAQFVAEHGGGDEIARVADAATAAIGAGDVRDPVSVGRAHGAFAPHNVFVGPGGAVAGFNMGAERCAPVYEDIAHFLMHLRRGRARRARGRRFLYGYFGDAPVPGRALAVFGLLARLDEWARLLDAPDGATSMRILRNEVRAISSALEDAEP